MKKNAFKIVLSAFLCSGIIFFFSCRSDVSEANLVDSVTPLLQKIIKQQNDLKSEAKSGTDGQTEKSTSERNTETETESESRTDPAEEPASPAIPEDTVPPEKVTDIKAVNHDGAVSLTWSDPASLDLFGIEITFSAPTDSESETTPDSPAAESSSLALLSRSLTPLESSARIIAPGIQYAFFNGLKNNVQYTFVLTALDTSGNRSLSCQKKITPKQIAISPMTVKLSAQNNDEEENSVKIEVEIKTESPLYKVKYAVESRACSYFKSRGTEIQETDGSYFFNVQEAGTYTVYARDTAGRQETAEITIKKVPL